MISVIVPIYNCEKYLRKCVDSLLAQSYPDIEIILVDDGSTDGSGKLADEYANRASATNRAKRLTEPKATNPSIRVIHQPNAGVSAARNRGIAEARGEYIMFCDADDTVEPEWCEWHLRAQDAYPGAMVCSDINREGKAQEKSYRVEPVDYFRLFQLGISGFPWNKLFRRDILLQHRITFDSSLPVGEDVQFTLDYLRHCAGGCVLLDAKLYNYATNESSALHRFHPDWMRYHLKSFYARVPFIAEEQMTDYCDCWLSSLIRMFGNVYDSRCQMTAWQKMCYNQRMNWSREFRFCLTHASCKSESPKIIWLLRTGVYPLFLCISK